MISRCICLDDRYYDEKLKDIMISRDFDILRILTCDIFRCIYMDTVHMIIFSLLR